MKAKRLVPGEIGNPHYSEADKRAAKRNGVPYDTKPFLTLPVGEIVDDPDCWRLCVGSDPVMVPADDECKQAVLAKMNDAERKATLAKVIRLNHPDVRKQQTKEQLAWVDMMLEIYAQEIDELQGSTKKPNSTKPQATPPT